MSTTTITKEVFGQTKDGKTVHRYTLRNAHQVEVDVITFGACVTSIRVPDRHGRLADVVCGFDNIPDYEVNAACFSCIIGRVTNRISKGEFTLDGVTYKLACNDFNGKQHLHGGPTAMHRQNWTAEVDGNRLRMTRVDPDGHEGYPGTMTVHVTYELTNENELQINYEATTTKACPATISDHFYWNLAGHDSGAVYDHTVTVMADKFCPADDNTFMTTGEILPVDGTLVDLREAVLLGDRMPAMTAGVKPGFNHHYVLKHQPGEKALAARVEHKKSGRVLEVYTTYPSLCFYTANYLGGVAGKEGATYNMHSSMMLMTQNYMNAINEPNFPSNVLRPGEIYQHSTCFKFTTLSQ